MEPFSKEPATCIPLQLDFPGPQVKDYEDNTLSTFREINGEDEVRIVLLGKTGAGKSSSGNTILGETVFNAACSPQSQTSICKRQEKEINGRRIVVIDTPGVFDTNRENEEELKKELISCLVECAPGPHVVILVLQVGRYTKENQEAVEKFRNYFSDDVLHHTVLLFTHGDDLDENMTIHDFVNQSDVEGETLKNLTEKCGNRVHVIDNKHWNKGNNSRVPERPNILWQFMNNTVEGIQANQMDEIPWLNILSDPDDNMQSEWQVESGDQSKEYRSNRFQIAQLMKSINNILIEKNREPFKNEALVATGEAIKEEVNNIIEGKKDKGEIRDLTEMDMVAIRSQAIKRVRTKIERPLAGVTIGILLGALLGFGVGASAPVVLVAGLIRAGYRKATRQRPQAGGAPVKTADVGAGITAAGVGAVAGAAAEITTAALAEAAVLGAGVGTGIGAGIGAGVCLIYGAGKGAISGYKISKTADNKTQAAKNVAQGLVDTAEDVLKACWNVGSKTETGDEAEEPLFKAN